MPPLLGYYSNFPTEIHRKARYHYQTSTRQLQERIARTLYGLNKETIDLKKLTISSSSKCFVNFEFGIAEHDAFNFFDSEELQRFQKSLNESKESSHNLDFYFAIRYSVMTAEGKRKPLRYDYLLLRFAFRRRIMEIIIVHERGPRRIPLEDLTFYVTNRINTELKQNGLKPFALVSRRAA